MTKFTTHGGAIDAIMRHRYLYYCLATSDISDTEYDALEKEVAKRWPDSPILQVVGWDTPSAYPDYTRDGRWPSPEERRQRNLRWGLNSEEARSLGIRQSVPANEQILVGTGMPQSLLLDEFGSHVWSVFGSPPYLVGSALHGKGWRDVDVRMILGDKEWDVWGFGNPDQAHQSEKWVSLCLAYSALGKSYTDLPIDFQIQQQTRANTLYSGARSTIGFVPRRVARLGVTAE